MIRITLKAARINANLSQKEVASILKVSNKTIHSWERYKTSPHPRYIDALCELYGLAYDNIIFLPDNSL